MRYHRCSVRSIGLEETFLEIYSTHQTRLLTPCCDKIRRLDRLQDLHVFHDTKGSSSHVILCSPCHLIACCGHWGCWRIIMLRSGSASLSTRASAPARSFMLLEVQCKGPCLAVCFLEKRHESLKLQCYLGVPFGDYLNILEHLGLPTIGSISHSDAGNRGPGRN